MQVSPDGLALIRRNEGCELVAYLDTLAKPPVWTIGYGDTLGVYEGKTITQAQADAALIDRLENEFVPGVLRALDGAPVTQNQLDAMASLAWNIGVHAFAGSTVARMHRAGNYQAAAEAFSLWNKAGGVVLKGLTRRRQEEADLYARGAPPAPVTAPAATGPLDAIKALQSVLAREGHYQAAIDGLWGRRSKAALNDLLAAAGQPRI